jgi:hypothetical protein
MFLGSALYERFWGGNVFENIAMIFFIASPLVVDRMLRATALIRKLRLAASSVFVALLLTWSSYIANNLGEDWQTLVPCMSAMVYILITWIPSRD